MWEQPLGLSVAAVAVVSRGLPASYFLDRQGVIRWIQAGPFLGKEQLKARLSSLLRP